MSKGPPDFDELIGEGDSIPGERERFRGVHELLLHRRAARVSPLAERRERPRCPRSSPRPGATRPP